MVTKTLYFIVPLVELGHFRNKRYRNHKEKDQTTGLKFYSVSKGSHVLNNPKTI